MKKTDLIIIIAALAGAVILFLIYNLNYRKSDSETLYVNVMVDNEIYGRYLLDTDMSQKIESIYGYNIIKIVDGKCYISESDCKNKICINTGIIENSGDTLCCLPHKLIVYID